MAALDGQTAAGGQDFFVMKFESSGAWVWTRQRGSASQDRAYSVATSSSGDVYVAGDTYGSLDGHTRLGFSDAFVMKFSSSGVWQWTRTEGVASSFLGAAGFGVAVSTEEDVYVAVQFVPFFSGNWEAMLLKYNANGDLLGSDLRASDTSSYEARSVAVGKNGDEVYVSGSIRGDANSNGGSDALLMRFDSAGVWQNDTQRGGVGNDVVFGVAVSSTGYIYVAGTTLSSTFDGGSSSGSCRTYG